MCHMRIRLPFLILLAAAPLFAAPAAGATGNVIFSGQPLLNLGTLSCPSTPDTGQITVPVGTTISVVNATGKTATLHVGTVAQTVPVGSQVPVTFADIGDATVRLIPVCLLDIAVHTSFTVHVIAQPAISQPATSSAPEATTPQPIAPYVGAVVPGRTRSTSARTGAVVGHTPAPHPTLPPPLAVGVARPVVTVDHGVSGLLTVVALVGIIGVGYCWVRAVRTRYGWVDAAD
jgi:hypothetical protein